MAKTASLKKSSTTKSHLTPKFIAEQRAHLVRIPNDVRRTVRSFKSVPRDVEDVLDDVLDGHTTARLSRPLPQIQHAIDNIDAGRYGICDECGEEIPLKRLKTVPETTRCVDCQKILEAEVNLDRLRATPDRGPHLGSEEGQDGDFA